MTGVDLILAPGNCSLVVGRRPHWLGDGQVRDASEGSEKCDQVLRESFSPAKVLSHFVSLHNWSCHQGERGVIPRGEGGRPGCQQAGQGQTIHPPFLA